MIMITAIMITANAKDTTIPMMNKATAKKQTLDLS